MKLLLRSSFVVSLATLIAVASATGKPAVRTWQISFELAFGEGSPYSQQIKPSLYEVPYATSHRVTSEVLPDIARRARIMADLQLVSLYYGPGGYEKYVNPSAQMVVRGTPAQARLACSIIGYLAQQTEVIASSEDPSGDVQIYDVVGFRSTGLDRLTVVKDRWSKLNSLSPKLVGFLPLRGPSGGIRVLNMGDKWNRTDYLSFHPSIASAFGPAAHEKAGYARLISSKNDWKATPSGNAYLSQLNALGRPDLARRVTGLRGQTERLIRRSYRKHMPVKTLVATN